MRGIKGIGIATFASLFLVTTLLSCAPGQKPEILGQAPEKQSPAPSAIAETELIEAANRPWYAERLETLGFHVFPEPVALPPFTLPALSGAPLDSSALSGSITLLNFWATWCPPCRAEMPSIEAMAKKLADEKFEVAAVSVQESRKTVESFLASTPYDFPIYLDESGAVSGLFVSQGIPTTFIIGKDGKVIAGTVGGRSYDGPEVIALFRELARR